MGLPGGDVQEAFCCTVDLGGKARSWESPANKQEVKPQVVKTI